MNKKTWIIVTLSLIALMVLGVLFALNFKTLRELHKSLPEQPDVSGKPEAFVEVLENANTQAKGYSKARAVEGIELLGKLYLVNGYALEAKQCWLALLQLDPEHVKWNYYLAEVQRLLGDEASMGGLLEKVVSGAPQYAPAWLKLANLRFIEGELDQAANSYLHRLELLENDSYASIGMARVEMQRGESAQAREWLEKSIVGTPKLPLGHNLLARLLRSSGETKEAERQEWLGTAAGRFREAPDLWIEELNQYCYDIDRLLMLGSIDFQTGFGDLGRTVFERVIKLDPENPEGYEALARVFLEKGEFPTAKQILEKGIELKGAPATMYVRLSEANRQLKDLHRALMVAESGLSKHPEDPDILKAMGAVLDELGFYDQAIQAYKRAMSDVSYEAEANLGIALVLEHADRKEEAYPYLYRALELRPKYPQAMAELGVLELDAWRLESAEDYIHGFYEAYPGSVRARELMTQLSVRKTMQAARIGDIEKAEQHAKAGLLLNPQSPELNSVLGLLYAQQQKLREAVVLLETARRATPGDVRVVMPLAQIYGQLGNMDAARKVLVEGERQSRNAGETASANEIRKVLNSMR